MRQWLKLFLMRGYMIAAQMAWIRLIQPLKKINDAAVIDGFASAREIGGRPLF
jgi:hypothetical protein